MCGGRPWPVCLHPLPFVPFTGVGLVLPLPSPGVVPLGVDPGPLTLPRPPIPLPTYEVLRPGRVHSQDSILGLLWPRPRSSRRGSPGVPGRRSLGVGSDHRALVVPTEFPRAGRSPVTPHPLVVHGHERDRRPSSPPLPGVSGDRISFYHRCTLSDSFGRVFAGQGLSPYKSHMDDVRFPSKSFPWMKTLRLWWSSLVRLSPPLPSFGLTGVHRVSVTVPAPCPRFDRCTGSPWTSSHFAVRLSSFVRTPTPGPWPRGPSSDVSLRSLPPTRSGVPTLA